MPVAVPEPTDVAGVPRRSPVPQAAELYVNDARHKDLAAADRLPPSSIDAEFYQMQAGCPPSHDDRLVKQLASRALSRHRQERRRTVTGGANPAARATARTRSRTAPTPLPKQP
ncbi:hypothetical protein SY2F82_77290 [Streptomyces sp. Y2F8-2]|uniref:hypothetical protein n=1 Tax=Streptomyces sp. Y2F8-2 TaxID=2759675 RepID=UPI001908E05F|nr:hypothetical protein [Streptomyces sp. Y2F8-2]GHK05932.1 hypothetical protein SY2F82_77290 [Streptomyces sp. Y2F8-2]